MTRDVKVIATNVSSTGEFFDANYFDPKKRREIRKEIEDDKRLRERERIENSEWSKEIFYWERKEGYHCVR